MTELADLARSVPTPANVALYAPWGSGKTGLAQLMELEFKNDPKVRFVRFDAKKYAEAPLRRQFISQLARQLGVDDDERFTKGLYGKVTTNTFTVPSLSQLRPLVVLFIGLFAALMALMVVAAVVYGLVAIHAFSDDFRGALGWLAPKAFIPAAFLSVVAALAGKQFGVERSVDAPSSDEEFEEMFKDLVLAAVGQRQLDAYGKKVVDDTKRRLVIFVDELDRCGANEVAATLETIGTFLDVPGSLFIVAADQQAVEEALSMKVSQATPRNSVSPYYSAGSAYLDKVFHYQQTVPPLKPQRLTAFALDLVRDREGVWERIRAGGDLDEVISVLIPTHVRSPRRVKALLNHFALLYRHAERRAEAGALAANVSERASELAKLACLRLEFPLFAADLVLDARMPALVYALDKDNDTKLPDALREDIKSRAKQWAQKELSVDEVLANEPVQVAEDGAAAQECGTEPVRREHTAQLLRYLGKTHRIPGPGRDLIHLESAAATLDVALDIADELEVEAVDGNRIRVRELVRALAGEQQLAAYRLLVHVVRHSAVGIEGTNAVGTLLEALAERKGPLGHVADEAASAIASHRYELTADDLLGAFELSLESSHEVGAELRGRVLDDADALASDRLCVSIVGAADLVIGSHPERAAQAVAALVERNSDELADELLELSEATACRLLSISAQRLQSLDDDPSAVDENVASMTSLLDRLIDAGRREVAEQYAAILVPMEVFDEAIEERLGKLSPTQTSVLAGALLARIPKLAISSVPSWLATVNPALIPEEGHDEVRDAISTAVVVAWDAFVAGTLAQPDMEKLLAALRPFAQLDLAVPSSALLAAVTRDAGNPLTNAAQIPERNRLLTAAAELELIGLLKPSQTADIGLGVVQQSSAAAAPASQIAAMGEVLMPLVRTHIGSASSEALRSLTAITTTNRWPGWTQTMVLLAAAELAGRDVLVDEPYSVTEMTGLVANYPTELVEGLAVWLRRFAPEPNDVWAVLEPLAGGELAAPVADALRGQCQWWRDTEERQHQHREFLELVTAGMLTIPVSASLLHAAKLSDADEGPMADHLVELYSRDKSVHAVRQILTAWDILAPRDAATPTKLINGILLPLAKTADNEQFDVVLEYLKFLKGIPQDRRNAVRRALRATAASLKRQGELEKRLERAGLKKPGGLLGKGSKKDR